MNTTSRDDALRALLVDRVGRSARRRRWLVPTIGVGAFVAAGALTAGALVGTGFLQQTLAPEDATALVETGAAGDVTLLGAPVVRVSDGATSLTLPDRPSGAHHVAVGLQCAPPETATVTVGADEGDGEPTTADCGTSITLPVGSSAGERPVVRVDHAGSPMTVWAAWARPDPVPGPSPEQQDAVEDGVVTRPEYVAAWDRYVGCMRASGHPVDLGPLQDPVVFAIADAGRGRHRRTAGAGRPSCAMSTHMWQNEHPDAQEFTTRCGSAVRPGQRPPLRRGGGGGRAGGGARPDGGGDRSGGAGRASRPGHHAGTSLCRDDGRAPSLTRRGPPAGSGRLSPSWRVPRGCRRSSTPRRRCPW